MGNKGMTTLVYYVKDLLNHYNVFLLACLTLFVMLLLTGSVSAECTSQIAPTILYSNEQSDFVTSQYSFRYPFKTGIMTEMKMSLNRLLYEGAKNSPHQIRYLGECSAAEMVEIEMEKALEKKQEQAYSAINNELTRLQGNFDQAGITGGVDTFLPVLLTFVASLSDDPDSNEDKFPIETMYERKGSLTDKTWLTLGLMENKGYNVAVVYYGSSIIPAVSGVSCEGKDGYLFIDIAEQTIGKRSKNYASVDPIAIIPFGQGTERYESATCVSDKDILFRLRPSPSMTGAIAITNAYAQGESQKSGDDIPDEHATMSELIQLIQEGSEELWVWNNLGVRFTEQNRFAEAESAFKRALEIDPTSVEALANLEYLLSIT